MSAALRKALSVAAAPRTWRLIASRQQSTTTVSSAVDKILLRSLKDHYLEISKMTPPPKVSPPSEFTVVKGALEKPNSPVLKRTFGSEEISINVMRLANIIPGGGVEDDEDGINQLFVHVGVSKPGQKESLHFLCGLYPDALGIHSVSMRPKQDEGFPDVPTKYNGPTFEDLDERMRDAFHNYIEERGITENLFPFLQAWLYVKDHRNLMLWFKAVGTFVNEDRLLKNA